MGKVPLKDLSQKGYYLHLAENAEKGMKVFKQKAFDLVVSDIRLRDMDKLQLLEHRKDHSVSSSIIPMTGYGSVQVAVEAIKKGAYEYILKPFSLEVLEGEIEWTFPRRRVENHLVLSGMTKDVDLAQRARQFNLLTMRSYIFTKLDETDKYTSLFNQLMRFKRPLSYLTSGQKVPEDIELVSKGKVASLILNRIPWN